MNRIKILCVIATSTLLLLVVPEVLPLAQSQEEDTEEEDTEEEDTEEEEATGQLTTTEVGNAMGQIQIANI